METGLKKKYLFRGLLFFVILGFLQYRYCLFYRYAINHDDFIKLYTSGDKDKRKVIYRYGLTHFCKNFPDQYEQEIVNFTKSIIDTTTYNTTEINIFDISKFYSEEVEYIKSGYIDEIKLSGEHPESYIYYIIHKKKLEENTYDKHSDFHWYIPKMKHLNPYNPLEVDDNIRVDTSSLSH